MKMKRMLLMFCAVVLLPVPSMAAMYWSPFGFSVDLRESEWMVVNSKTIMEDAEVRRDWEKALGTVESRWPLIKKKELMRMLETGEVEYWWDKLGDSTANVNVTKWAGKGVLGREYGKAEIEGALKKLLGPEVRIYDFGWRKIGGLESFWYEWSGMMYGMRCICLNVQVQKQAYLGFTLTATEKELPSMRLRFWNVMSSFQWLR